MSGRPLAERMVSQMIRQTFAGRYATALVVDDDALSARIIEHALRTLSVPAVTTADSVDAATALLTIRPDLVVTEVLVAHEPCFSFLQLLSQLPSPPTIIATSRKASRAQVFRLSAYGVS